MTVFFSDFWKVLTLDRAIYERTKSDNKGLLFAIKLFVIVALVFTFGTFLSTLAAGPQGPYTRLMNSTSQLEQLSEGTNPLLAQILSRLQQQVESIASMLEQYQPPLGRQPSFILRTIGAWLTAPLSMLGGWMAAGLAVFLVAKLLKGSGDLREHLSLFLLGAAPQILMVISGFAFFGSVFGVTGTLLNLVALAWSLVILVTVMNVAHGFTSLRSVAVLLIALVFFGVVVPLLVALPGLLGVISLLR